MRIIYTAILCTSALAHAEPELEVGAAIGGHAFSANSELRRRRRHDAARSGVNFALGARAAYFVLPRLAIEGEAMAIPTHDNTGGSSALAFGVRAHARFDVLDGRLRAVRARRRRHAPAATSSTQMHGDADQALHWGGGVRWALSAALDVRVDARHLIVPDRTLDGATSDFRAHRRRVVPVRYAG